MFDGPKYQPPIRMPEAAQIQHLKRYPRPPNYYIMALHILREISEYIQPYGVFWPNIAHILVADLELRLLRVSGEDRDKERKKATKELARIMLTVAREKFLYREACKKIKKAVCEEMVSANRLGDYVDENYLMLFHEDNEFMDMTEENLLSFTLNVFCSMNILKLAGEDDSKDIEEDAQRKAQERRKKISDFLKRLLSWAVIIIIALILIAIFMLAVTWEMGA